MAEKNKDNAKKRNADLHKQHRSRVKQKFNDTGLKGFHDHNVLEMMLFYSIPRIDTNEIAHTLINEFGSFQAVFEASFEALTSVDGIGYESATLIKFFSEFISYYEASKTKDMKNIKDSEDAYKFLKKFYSTPGPEKFVVVYLDGKGDVLSTYETTQDSKFMVKTDFNVILKKAVLLDAQGIVISHNHDGGFSTPSLEDKVLTEKLSELCAALGIMLCEHIIFAHGQSPTFLSKIKQIKKGTLAF